MKKPGCRGRSSFGGDAGEHDPVWANRGDEGQKPRVEDDDVYEEDGFAGQSETVLITNPLWIPVAGC
jgi:hypothetical protein